MAYPQTLTVELGARSYPIVIGNGLIDAGFDLSQYLPGRDCLVVSNETVAPIYLEKIRGCLGDATIDSVELPDGESHKTIASCENILDKLVATGANRDTAVVALGGGVVGDIAGFAAACYMRGVSFIQVPTTLLAQVDSSVGGKTGVNHLEGKNLIGAFHQPRAVLIDTATLDTLPDREFKAGLAEVIKYGAVLDADFFAWLESNMTALLRRDADSLRYAITRSCVLKAQIVAADEKEAGQRALLNYGHTFGHAIENTLGYGKWLHGEAVAAGMVAAAAMSGLDEVAQERLRKLLVIAGLPTSLPNIGQQALRTAMKLDKKVQGKRIRFVLLRSLGDAYVSDDYQESDLETGLKIAAT